MITEFDREKFKDAMHYVIALAGDRPGFGAIKLYKVLWFSDARTFLLEGHPITGEEYIRQKYGPMPRHGLPVRTELEKEGRVRIWEDRYYNRPITRFKSQRLLANSRLSSEEMGTLRHWALEISGKHTAETISDESHDYAWEIAKMGETLPYHAFLAAERLRDPTEEDFKRARKRWGDRL
jgi:hypothetical protein